MLLPSKMLSGGCGAPLKDVQSVGIVISHVLFWTAIAIIYQNLLQHVVNMAHHRHPTQESLPCFRLKLCYCKIQTISPARLNAVHDKLTRTVPSAPLASLCACHNLVLPRVASGGSINSAHTAGCLPKGKNSTMPQSSPGCEKLVGCQAKLDALIDQFPSPRERSRSCTQILLYGGYILPEHSPRVSIPGGRECVALRTCRSLVVPCRAGEGHGCTDRTLVDSSLVFVTRWRRLALPKPPH